MEEKIGTLGCKIAADDAMATTEGDAVFWCTSGVVVAVANHLTAVVSTKGGKVESIEENQGQLLKLGLSAMKEHIFCG